MKYPKYRASIIIVSFNYYDETTGPCLDSLQEDPAFSEFEIIVVDNSSDPKTVDCLTKHETLKNFKLIRNDTNLGFGTANNIGINKSTAPIIILLNSDTIVPSGAMSTLSKLLESNPTWSGVGPVTNSTGNEQLIRCEGKSIGEILDFSKLWTQHSPQSYLQTNQLSFFCIALTRTTIEEVGHFDETYGLGYYEDVDYCIRISNAGKTLYIAENVFIYHKGSKSFSKTPRKVKELMRKNRKILLRKFGELARKNLIHLRDANLGVLWHYVHSFSIENKKNIDFRFQERLKLAKVEMPKGYVKKFIYLRKILKVEKAWKELNAAY